MKPGIKYIISSIVVLSLGIVLGTTTPVWLAPPWVRLTLFVLASYLSA